MKKKNTRYKIPDTKYKMRIGIDASRAFSQQRTGIEEYSYQVIKSLTDKLNGHQARLASTSGLRESRRVVLYIRKNQKIDFELPANWRTETIKFPYLWTQVGLSLKMIFHPVDALFIPAHVVPLIHPRYTIVTVHGLEFEIYPEGYSFLARLYMRWSIKMSCRWAKKIIAVSENTKNDLMRLYKVPEKKIEVIYEGVSRDQETVSGEQYEKYKPYILFVGRLEKRKNIKGIIRAYKILREKYNISHKLILAGKPGYGYESIRHEASGMKYENDIIFPGFVSERDKRGLLRNADTFLFPSFYEGFGLPVLEAQNYGVPVVAGNVSSLSEVGGNSVIYCDSERPESIAEAVHKLISNPELKNDIIDKGYENIKRFSWGDCSFRISKILTDGTE